MPNDFTLHFEIPTADLPPGASPAELECAFALEQIRTLLEFVTLYENGRPVNPDGFSIVNAPSVIHAMDGNPKTKDG